MIRIRDLCSSMRLRTLVVLMLFAMSAYCQTKASVVYRGSSCRNEAGPIAPKCLASNEGNEFTAASLISNSRYYIRVQEAMELSISGFALRTKVETTGPVVVRAYLVGADVLGAPDPNKILSRGSVNVKQKFDWYMAWLCPAVKVPANDIVYLAFDNPNPGILESTAKTGRDGVHYRQPLPSGGMNGPFTGKKWVFRVRCGAECPALVALTPPRYGNGQDFVIEVQNGTPMGYGATMFGFSDTTFGNATLPIDLSSLVPSNNPNCQLQVSIAQGNGHGIDPVGKSRIVIPIKNKGLIGTKFYVQTIMADPNTLQFVNTQYIEAVIGY
ncbi:MAG: hypothetical protein H6832_02800 [Planctomycetes bacterium]|nr:hypothetical protein [Planctomycetota bacterium]MCB9917310.1 hypothetical protein [Planctomycetota bacterium]